MNIHLPENLSIYGIGTDLVSMQRIKKIWDHFGHAFARRILTTKELLEFQNEGEPISFLAKRYAAKEAVAKAMGTGFRPTSFWLTDIGVHRDSLGKPHLHYTEKMQAILKTEGIMESYISLSDEKEHALAFVVLVSNAGSDTNT